jgi:hypothetical protein
MTTIPLTHNRQSEAHHTQADAPSGRADGMQPAAKSREAGDDDLPRGQGWCWLTPLC